MDISLILLACFGLTNILVNSIIMDRFRNFIGQVEFFKELISCSMCTGFWVGIYFALILFFTCVLPEMGVSLLVSRGIFYLMTIPFASSGVSWILEKLGIILDVIAHELDKD